MIPEKRYLVEPYDRRGRSSRAVSTCNHLSGCARLAMSPKGPGLRFVRDSPCWSDDSSRSPDSAGDCHSRMQFRPAKDAVSRIPVALGTASGPTQTKGSFQTSNSISSEQLEQSSQSDEDDIDDSRLCFPHGWVLSIDTDSSAIGVVSPETDSPAECYG
jgi:hypothetical protein